MPRVTARPVVIELTAREATALCDYIASLPGGEKNEVLFQVYVQLDSALAGPLHGGN